jgi:hypothetical protein
MPSVTRAAQCHIDVGFWGGIVPGNDDQIERSSPLASVDSSAS